MTPESIASLIGSLISSIIAMATFIWAIKKFSTEKIAILADAKADEAEAEQSRAETEAKRLQAYNEAITTLMQRDQTIMQQNTLLIQRDGQIAELSSHYQQLKIEFDAYKLHSHYEREREKIELQQNINTLSDELREERTLRIAAQDEAKSAKEQVDALTKQRSTNKKKINQLTVMVNDLMAVVQTLSPESIAHMQPIPMED